jgi:membrane protein
VSLGLAKQIPGGAAVLLGFIPLLFTAIAFTLIYYVLPNRPIQFRHAVTGGIVAAMMFELMKRGFAFYVAKFPTYTLVYGAFAAVPIFLIWLYLSWVVALLGAVITALLPNIRIWREQVDPSASGPFHDALNLLRVLVRAQRVARTPSTRELCMEAYVPHDAAERLLEQMHAAGWVARVVGDRWALACDPDTVSIADVYSWLVLAPAVGKGGQRNAVIDGLIDRAVASANHSLAAPIRMLATESIVGNIAKLESPDAANAARMGAKPS